MDMNYGTQNFQQGQGQQAQMGTMQVPQMNTPPAVITTKDLAYIKDALSWELLAAKKCNLYSQMAQDPEIAGRLTAIGQVHERHYQLLLSQLDSNKTLI